MNKNNNRNPNQPSNNHEEVKVMNMNNNRNPNQPSNNHEEEKVMNKNNNPNTNDNDNINQSGHNHGKDNVMTNNNGKTPENEGKLTFISLELIDDNGIPGYQVGRQGIDNDLLLSIEQLGVIQPLCLRPNPNSPGRYIIVSGRRRYYAAKKAKLPEVPAYIMYMDNDTYHLSALNSNVHVEQLNPINRAKTFRHVINKLGYTQKQLASKLKKDRTYVTNALSLLKLPESVQEHILNGKLTQGQALPLVGMKNAEELADEMIARNLNVRESETLASSQKPQKTRSGASRTHKATDKWPEKKAHEDEMCKGTGWDTSIHPQTATSGYIKIPYESMEEFLAIKAKLLHV